MLTSNRQNYHHSILPALGAIGHIAIDPRIIEYVPYNDIPKALKRKCIVIAYPLTDSPDYRYSRGIHTCYIQFLDNGEIKRIAGHLFREYL